MKVVIVMVQTIDGKIGKDAKHEVDWTSSADKKSFSEETKKLGVLIMGSSTFNTIGRPLPGRLNLILTSKPEKYQAKAEDGVLEFVSGSPADIVAMLEKRGFKTAALGGGAKTNAAWLKAGMVDEILLTIEPLIFGKGINFTQGEELDLKLELIETNRLNEDSIQLRYKVLK